MPQEEDTCPATGATSACWATFTPREQLRALLAQLQGLCTAGCYSGEADRPPSFPTGKGIEEWGRAVALPWQMSSGADNEPSQCHALGPPVPPLGSVTRKEQGMDKRPTCGGFLLGPGGHRTPLTADGVARGASAHCAELALLGTLFPSWWLILCLAFLCSVLKDKTIKLWKITERDKRPEGYNLKDEEGKLKDLSTVTSLQVGGPHGWSREGSMFMLPLLSHEKFSTRRAFEVRARARVSSCRPGLLPCGVAMATSLPHACFLTSSWRSVSKVLFICDGGGGTSQSLESGR